MNRISQVVVVLRCLVLYGMFFTCGCMQGGTGTEVGNPARVSGRVRDNNDKAVANAVVFLVSHDYNAVLDTIDQLDVPAGEPEPDGMIDEAGIKRIFTRTNSGGEFVFDSVAPHFYNLFIADSSVRRMGFRPGITVNASRIDLGECEIRDVGYATVLVNDSIFNDKGYISLPGTPIKKVVDSAGEYTIPVFYDSITVNYYGTSGDSISAILSDYEVSDIVSGDTIDLTGIETIIIPPVLAVVVENSNLDAAGNPLSDGYYDTLFSPVELIRGKNTLVNIAALGATINKKTSLEYQFYNVTKQQLSAWGSDSIYLLPLDSNIEYSVACRVRSGSDTSSVTTWTQGLRIRIRSTSDSLVIPIPSAPIPIDTFLIQDSLYYSFSVPVNGDTQMLNHRIRWIDTVNQQGFSIWGRDSVCSVHFPSPGMFIIQAQVQSVEDSSRVSLWSDSLLFAVEP